MRTLDLRFSPEDPTQALIKFCQTNGLKPSNPTPLKTYPGSLHWHLTKPGQAGTLELTWWPKGQRLWAKVASNREAPWIDQALQELAKTFGTDQ
jgi:hypothetical protein